MIHIRKRALSALALVIALAGAKSALAVDESVTFTNWEPVQTTDGTLGTLKTHTFSTGGYTLGKINISGNLEEINGTTGDYVSENRIHFRRPDGTTFIIQTSATNGYTGVFNFSMDSYAGMGYAMPGAGAWEFRYFNTFDDAPTGGVPDARINSITIKMTDQTPQPPTAEDLGTIGSAGLSIVRAHTVPGEVKWYKFTITEATGAKFFDIDTEGTSDYLGGTFANDTMIGVYTSGGDLVSYDDDSGTDFLSYVSFGTASSGHGADGDLAAGTYYLSVSGWPSTFGASVWQVTSTAGHTGNVHVNFATDIGGGGGGGGTFVNPSAYQVNAGFDFSGQLSSVFADDGDMLCILSDDTTLVGELQFSATNFGGGFNTLKFITKTEAGRPGLAISIKMFNFATNQYVERGGGVAPTTSTVMEAVVSSLASQYSDEAGSLRSRVTWAPINDEDPSQDGWLLCMDVARWQLITN